MKGKKPNKQTTTKTPPKLYSAHREKAKCKFLRLSLSCLFSQSALSNVFSLLLQNEYY